MHTERLVSRARGALLLASVLGTLSLPFEGQSVHPPANPPIYWFHRCGTMVQGATCQLLFLDDEDRLLWHLDSDVNPFTGGPLQEGDRLYVDGMYDMFDCPASCLLTDRCIQNVTLGMACAGSAFTQATCLGNGSGLQCPCGNNSSSLLEEGCRNSTGAGGELLLLGSGHVSAGDATLVARQVPPQGIGLFVQGRGQLEVPFGDGLFCMGAPTERLEVVPTGPAGYAATSVALAAVGGAVPGDVLYYQFYYRDSVGSVCGHGFNFTSGLALLWQ